MNRRRRKKKINIWDTFRRPLSSWWSNRFSLLTRTPTSSHQNVTHRCLIEAADFPFLPLSSVGLLTNKKHSVSRREQDWVGQRRALLTHSWMNQVLTALAGPVAPEHLARSLMSSLGTYFTQELVTSSFLMQHLHLVLSRSLPFQRLSNMCSHLCSLTDEISVAC